MPLPANVRLIDPATNAVSTETSVDVWRSGAECFQREADRARWRQSAWPRGPNTTGGYQLDGRKADSAGAGAGRTRSARADRRFRLPSDCSTILPRFRTCCSRRPRVRVLADAVRNGVSPLPDVDPPLNALGSPGQGRVHARLRPVPRWTRPVDHPGAAAAALSRHQVHCPRPVDTVVPARFTFVPCPPRLARNARTYEFTPAQWHGCQAHQFRSRSRAVDRLRRRPGRHDDWNKFDVPTLARNQQDGAVLPQQQRRYAGTGGRSIHRVFQARPVQCAPGRAAIRDDRRRAFRSPAVAGRNGSAGGLSTQAL